MRTMIKLTGHFFRKRLLSGRNAAFLFVIIGVLLAGALVQQANQQRLSNYLGSLDGQEEGFVFPFSSLHPGSGRLNAWEAVNGTLQLSETMLGGALFLLRAMTPLLAFFLLLAGLLYAYDMVSSDLETRLMDSLLGLPVDRRALGLSKAFGETLALALTLAVGCMAALVTVSVISGLQWTLQQMIRTIIFLLILGAYCFLFVLLGMWISAIARSSQKALWICSAVFVAVFSVHAVVENAASLDRAHLPDFPDLPREVSQHFEDAKIRGYPDSDWLPPEVEAYFAELDAYSTELADFMRSRYRNERWWSFLSPPGLLIEVSGPLLQDQYYHVLDVFYSPEHERRPASLGASLRQAGPEIVWLGLLCLALMALNIRTLTRLEV